MAEQFLADLLVCPVCKAQIEFLPGEIACTSCGLIFSQPQDDYIDVLPQHLLRQTDTHWKERQLEMEAWYKELTRSSANALACFEHDYAPYGQFLGTFSGTILDVGGGVGIVRHFLSPQIQYISLDPSLDWLEMEWVSLTKQYPGLTTRPRFVRGVGEYLPFPPRVFDAVFSFWSMNHCSDPEMVFCEAYRVLRPGGRFLVVLEDMAHSWRDIVARILPGGAVHRGGFFRSSNRRLIWQFLRKDWPLQPDHIRIEESDIRHWISQRFEITRRVWIKNYLTFEFSKITG